jgi:hypothetical protein
MPLPERAFVEIGGNGGILGCSNNLPFALRSWLRNWPSCLAAKPPGKRAPWALVMMSISLAKGHCVVL